MRRLMLAVLVCSTAACARYEGPREVYQKNRQGDQADRREGGQPVYSLDEQQRRARERLTIIDDNGGLPKTFADRPDPIGR